MSKTFIFGHKNPDTDSIISSIVMEDLEKHLGNDNAIACRLGDINKETTYALKYLKVDVPKYIESIDEGTSVILVDHNEFEQSINEIEKAKITKVVDHHRICGFQTAEPLFYISEPVGCTSTILFEIYKTNNIEITPTIAGLMLSAIISDTLLLKSPTTTIKDIKAVEELATIANIDYKIYGLDMLKAGTDLSSFSIDEILNIDAKTISLKDKKSIIAQVNTASIPDVMKMKNNLEDRMMKIIEENNLDLFMFLITDIINSNSQVIALGNSASIVEKAYGVKLENNTALLPGVVSRKKQVVPIMTENA